MRETNFTPIIVTVLPRTDEATSGARFGSVWEIDATGQGPKKARIFHFKPAASARSWNGHSEVVSYYADVRCLERIFKQFGPRVPFGDADDLNFNDIPLG